MFRAVTLSYADLCGEPVTSPGAAGRDGMRVGASHVL